MAFYDRWIDKKIRSLGYTKQDDLGVSRGIQFSGDFDDVASLIGLGADWSAEQLEKMSFENYALYSNIDLIMNLFSQAHLQVYKKKGEKKKQQIDNHPLETLIDVPSEIPWIDRSFLWRFTAGWSILRNEIYWMLVSNQLGELAEIIPIPPTKIKPHTHKKKYIDYFEYYPSTYQTEPIKLKPHQVFYWRNPDLWNQYRGFSLSKVYGTSLKIANKSDDWNLDNFEKGLALQTILGLSDELGDKEFKRARADLLQSLQDEKARFLAMRSGDLKATSVGTTPKDAEFVNQQNLSERKLDRSLGFPQGFWDKMASYASATVAKALVIDYVVWPRLDSIAAAITPQILWRYYNDKELRCEFEDIRIENRELLLSERSKYWEVKTIDEAREELGLEPMEDEMHGGLLVPLGTNPQYVSQVLGGTAGGVEEGAQSGKAPVQTEKKEEEEPLPSDEDNTQGSQTESGAEKQFLRDLGRWEKVSLKQIARGERPESYDFQSDWISDSLKELIHFRLEETETEEDIRGLFTELAAKAIVFIPRGNEESLVEKVKKLDISDEDAERAVLLWDGIKEFKSVKGLLDAIPEVIVAE